MKPYIATLLVVWHCAVLAPSVVWAQATKKFDGPHHMKLDSAKRLRVTITESYECPNLRAITWGVYAGHPPSFEGQKDIKAAMTIPGVDSARIIEKLENGLLRQRVLYAHWRVSNRTQLSEMTTRRTYEVTLTRRKLLPGASQEPTPRLTRSQRNVFLAASGDYDFENPMFQEWRQKHDLLKNPSENELSFAYRTLRRMAESHTYKDCPHDQKASLVAKQGWSHCGGLSSLYTAILRSNGIAARTLVGRVAKNSAKANDPTTLHVKVEFFAEGIGWVPVEVAEAVDKKIIDRCFGRDDGNLLVMHFDHVWLDDYPRSLQRIQGHFGEHEGDFDDYESTDEITVEVLKSIAEDSSRSKR